ncbi:hypothetical protein KKH27_00805 [bacterium]|nr:hypothetical protein [bacterium]MBU1984420.1 hypothetical protein [bacterium]
MNRAILVCVLALLVAGYAGAVPSFTPVVDGIKDVGWGSVPDHSTTTLREPVTFNLDSGFYVTDDSEFIYFGFWADNDPWTDAMNPHIHILMDIGSTADGGTFAAWGANNVLYAHAFKPEYDIVTQWGDGAAPYTNDIQFTGLNRWVTGSWNQIMELTIDDGGGSQWTEIAVRKADIGSPANGVVLNLSMWLRPAWNKAGGNCCLPADEDFPSDWANTAGTFDQQFAYTLQAAISDTDPPGIDHVHQIDRTGIEIVFDEPMDTTTFLAGNFTPTGWTFTGFRYKTSNTVGISAAPPGFQMGTVYSVVLSSAIEDVAGNSMDPADDSTSWTGVGYADVTFLCIDASATHDTILFKGSFNFYHEYDAFWSGGSHLMYDDGTHGDVATGDHTFTRIWPMVPNGGTPNFEWGVRDEFDNWLVIGPNPSFSLPDTNDITVSYTIPDVTHNPVDVTFTVDMQFIPATIDSMMLAGSFTDWGTNPVTMTNNLDGTYSRTVNFPAGSQRTHYFKFIRMEGGNQDWEGISDREFDLDDSQPTLNLGLLFFNNWIPAPYDVTAYPATGGVDIRWNDNYQRVEFEVYGSSNLYSIIEPINLLGIVPAGTGNHFLDTDVTATSKFYQVRTVYTP